MNCQIVILYTRFQAAGNFLLSAAVDADVAVAAEALDAIFDVFGDDDDMSDDVRKAEKEIRLVSRLSDLVTGFHEKVSLCCFASLSVRPFVINIVSRL